MYIYADNAATTKINPVAMDVMNKCMDGGLRESVQPPQRRPEGGGGAAEGERGYRAGSRRGLSGDLFHLRRDGGR